MMFDVPSLTALGTALTALATIFLAILTAILAKATNRLKDISSESRRSERVNATRDLYNQFFSLVEARTNTWYWLESLSPEGNRQSFEQLWRVRDQSKFMELYKVLAVWFLLYRLYQANELDKSLAKALFIYEFYFWSRHIEWFVKYTIEHDRIFPDVLEPFEHTSWLLPPDYFPRATKLSTPDKSLS